MYDGIGTSSGEGGRGAAATQQIVDEIAYLH